MGANKPGDGTDSWSGGLNRRAADGDGMVFGSLFQRRFATSQEAVETCQRFANHEGFSVRIRTSKANTVYIVCSKEGKPEHKLSLPKKRNRNSERCHCSWRIVLTYNASIASPHKWEFRPGKSMAHNHSMSFHLERQPAAYLPHTWFAPLQPKQAPLNITLPSIHTLIGNIPDYYPSSRTLSPSHTPSAIEYDDYTYC